MRGTARRLLATVALVVATGAGMLAAPVGHSAVAGAATPHRAAVIVDTGTTVHKVVITFTEDSITGIDALQRAHADPVVYAFNGQGGAVCRVFGVGRDAGPNCLGGQDGDARYWAYFRAPAGTTSFTYSSVGAGTAKVHDGDVEGWKYGTGAAPQFVSLASLVPAHDPAPTDPPAQVPADPSGSSAPNGSTPLAGNQGLADAATSVSTLPVTGATGSTASATGPKADAPGSARATGGSGTTADDGKGHRSEAAEAALASASSGGGNSASSLIWFVVLLALIVIAIVVARRVRRRSAERSAS